MIAQRREQFAGHEGLEALNAAVLDDRPFGVRAGQNDEARAGLGEAEDLDLLAAHYVGLAVLVLIRQAGDDQDAPPLRLDRDKPIGDRARIGRTFHVRRLAPAVAAADHARGDDRQGGSLVEPRAEKPPVRRRKFAARNGSDAVSRREGVEDRALSRHAIGAEAG